MITWASDPVAFVCLWGLIVIFILGPIALLMIMVAGVGSQIAESLDAPKKSKP